MQALNRRGVLTAAGTVALAATAAANEPIRGKGGANILGPTNPARQAEEPFTTSPPSTDNGTMPAAISSTPRAPAGFFRAGRFAWTPMFGACSGTLMLMLRS